MEGDRQFWSSDRNREFEIKRMVREGGILKENITPKELIPFLEENGLAQSEYENGLAQYLLIEDGIRPLIPSFSWGRYYNPFAEYYREYGENKSSGLRIVKKKE
jgi:hypothetical protein